MATIYVKLLPSEFIKNEGIIYYQIVHNHEIRKLKTNYILYLWEWDKRMSKIKNKAYRRRGYLQFVEQNINCDIRRINDVVTLFEAKQSTYSADDIVSAYYESLNERYLFVFMQKVIELLRQNNKKRTSETYTSTLKSFIEFRNYKDILLQEINSVTMQMYESYLQRKGLVRNTTSFYFRILRAVYNRAVEKDLTTNRNPFKHVYTGIDKTVKRAIPLKTIKRIKNLDLSLQPSLEFARDIFLFSFYTRGMSFIDMTFLRKKDLRNGILVYRRRKTGQQLFIRWEKCMKEIVNKYDTSQSPYLLPIINPCSDVDERKQYTYMAHKINRSLKIIGKELEISGSLTLYVARHSWASIARSKNIPISVISEGMGHDSEKTTQIYLASLDTAVVDRANAQILKDL